MKHYIASALFKVHFPVRRKKPIEMSLDLVCHGCIQYTGALMIHEVVLRRIYYQRGSVEVFFKLNEANHSIFMRRQVGSPDFAIPGSFCDAGIPYCLACRSFLCVPFRCFWIGNTFSRIIAIFASQIFCKNEIMFSIFPGSNRFSSIYEQSQDQLKSPELDQRKLSWIN